MNIVALIPARMGSKRIRYKNLRLIEGKPLIEYILDTVCKVKIFDDIYINSESDVFFDIAKRYGVNFHKRPEELSSDTATNDEFAYEFLRHIECDLLIQVLPTSPFLTGKDINAFVDKMVVDGLDTLISVEHKQIACVYQGESINFDKFQKNPPSQTMVPVKAYATGLMGWNAKKFIKNMEKFGVAYHGGEGKTDYFELRGLSVIDIDREEDFRLAESIIISKTNDNKAEYYVQETPSRIEVDVPSILAKDGVVVNDLFDVNNELVALPGILESMPEDVSWSKRIIDTESNSMTIISQMPGEGNRRHLHPHWHEWWYIVEGEWEWEIEGKIRNIVQGDIVFINKNCKHKITAIGTKRAVRMAVSRADVEHVYQE